MVVVVGGVGIPAVAVVGPAVDPAVEGVRQAKGEGCREEEEGGHSGHGGVPLGGLEEHAVFYSLDQDSTLDNIPEHANSSPAEIDLNHLI